MNLTIKTFSIIIWLSLVFSTFICGIWIGFSSEMIELSDKIFHMGLASLTIISTLWIFKISSKTELKGVSN